MPKWVTWVKIAASSASLVAVALLLPACLEMPTLETTPTIVPTTLPPTVTATGAAMTIEITGDVYVRDNEGNVWGWLYKADHVQATCLGDWCQIISGSYSGYHFWRGCSSNNPERKSCQAK